MNQCLAWTISCVLLSEDGGMFDGTRLWFGQDPLVGLSRGL